MDQMLPVRSAATVLPLRDGPQGVEVLMLRRNLRSDFVGGAYVFPGGAVDDDDHSVHDLVVGLSDDVASARLGVVSGALASYVAAVRELFEEAGLLLACDENGAARQWDDAATVGRMALNRLAVNAGTIGFFDMLRGEGLRLDLRDLHYLAHWVTPLGPPRRFDTRFFVTRAPQDQVATHDEGETVADAWIRPIDAIAAQQRGDFEMILPTITNLRGIAHFATVDDVLEHAQSQENIPRIEPRIVEVDGVMRIMLPDGNSFDA